MADKPTSVRAQVWQHISFSLAATILTGATAWLTFGQDKITRAELIEYVTTQAPWITERGVIQANIRINTEHIDKNQENISKLATLSNNLVTRLEVLTAQFEIFLAQQREKE